MEPLQLPRTPSSPAISSQVSLRQPKSHKKRKSQATLRHSSSPRLPPLGLRCFPRARLHQQLVDCSVRSPVLVHRSLHRQATSLRLSHRLLQKRRHPQSTRSAGFSRPSQLNRPLKANRKRESSSLQPNHPLVVVSLPPSQASPQNLLPHLLSRLLRLLPVRPSLQALFNRLLPCSSYLPLRLPRRPLSVLRRCSLRGFRLTSTSI